MRHLILPMHTRLHEVKRDREHDFSDKICQSN
jgi:hypothetical protein